MSGCRHGNPPIGRTSHLAYPGATLTLRYGVLHGRARVAASISASARRTAPKMGGLARGEGDGAAVDAGKTRLPGRLPAAGYRWLMADWVTPSSSAALWKEQLAGGGLEQPTREQEGKRKAAMVRMDRRRRTTPPELTGCEVRGFEIVWSARGLASALTRLAISTTGRRFQADGERGAGIPPGPAPGV